MFLARISKQLRVKQTCVRTKDETTRRRGGIRVIENMVQDETKKVDLKKKIVKDGENGNYKASSGNIGRRLQGWRASLFHT